MFNASGGSIVVSGFSISRLTLRMFPQVGRGFGCRGGFQCDFSLDCLREGLEDLPCETRLYKGNKKHQGHACSAGLVGGERKQEKSQTPA